MIKVSSAFLLLGRREQASICPRQNTSSPEKWLCPSLSSEPTIVLVFISLWVNGYLQKCGSPSVTKSPPQHRGHSWKLSLEGPELAQAQSLHLIPLERGALWSQVAPHFLRLLNFVSFLSFASLPLGSNGLTILSHYFSWCLGNQRDHHIKPDELSLEEMKVGMGASNSCRALHSIP